LKQSGKNYKRIVVKVGSSLFCSSKECLDFSLLNHTISQISALVNQGHEVVVVSSGAIALGMRILDLKSRPKDLSILQAAAAIGQNALMDSYSRIFKDNKLTCAQVLLTWEDFDDRSRYLNAKNTISTLLKLKSIPVINENDTISTAEIKFGDNDRLSALVASLISADLLIMLSDVDGLLMKDKKTVVNFVEEINEGLRALARPTDKSTSVGGMITKIEAAKIAVDSGITCVIANGKTESIISEIAKDPLKGGNWTVFLSKKTSLAAKERWIAFGSKPKGRIIVDSGAKKALLNKKSLLSVGIIDSEGKFEDGDIISIADQDNKEFARGKCSISYRMVEKVKGKRSAKEIIHCDNIVILN